MFLKKKKIFVWNTNPVRDFIFAEDAADAVVKLVNSNYTGVVNIGTGKSYPVETLTNIISSVSKKQILSKNKKVSGPYKFLTNINLLKKITKWKPKYTLKQGLSKNLQYHEKLLLMKICIFGGNGFIGSNLANYYHKKKHKVYIYTQTKVNKNLKDKK